MTVRLPNSSVSSGVRLPSGVVLKPPVRIEELSIDVDQDPDEAEALVALIRQLRRERVEPAAE